MKRKSFRRTASLLLAMLMCFTVRNTAFAMEKLNETEKTWLEIMVAGEDEVEALANQPASGVVPSNSGANFYPTLDSYVGISKTIVVNAYSNSNSGALLLYLYNPSHKLVSKNWIMGVNEIVQWKLTLPSSGIWRLYAVAQGTTASVNLYTKWQ